MEAALALICRCMVEGSECKVWVGRNAHFVLRMHFKVPKRPTESSSEDPWKYDGPLPRRKGRWYGRDRAVMELE